LGFSPLDLGPVETTADHSTDPPSIRDKEEARLMPVQLIVATEYMDESLTKINANFTYLEGLAGGGTAKYATTLTAVTGTVPVTHNLNSQDIVVSIWDAAGKLVQADVQIVDANNISIAFLVPFTGRVVVRS